MSGDLPIINFSTKKYVDASTLSRIRSHAQQRVQDQRLARKNKNEDDPSLNAARTSRDVLLRGERAAQQSFTFIFEQTHVRKARPAATANTSAKRRRRPAKRPSTTPVAQVTTLAKRESHSLSASPGERVDPFASFPVTVDREFMELAEGYLLGWKWPHPKALLFRETLSSPVLVHSYLAIAHHIYRKDEWKSMWHENVAMSYIRTGLQKVNTLSPQKRLPLAGALTWSIIRLATIKINQGQLETSISHLNALALISPDMTEWDGTLFGGHFQAATASLLLANYTQSSRVRASLHLPFGPMTTTAISDVESLGFSVPPSANMLSPIIPTLLNPPITDALLALTALYNSTTASLSSLPHTHSGHQAREAVKIALRLARLNDIETEPFPNADRTWKLEFAECVRLTAMLFTWEFQRPTSSQNDTVASARRHNRAFLTSRLLENLFAHFGHVGANRCAVNDLVLWVLIVCGSTTPKAEDRAYYADLTRWYFEDSWKWSYADVQRLGRVLPWFDPPKDPPAEAWWELVTSPDGQEDEETQKRLEGNRRRYWDGDVAPMLLGYVAITPGLEDKAKGYLEASAQRFVEEEDEDEDGLHTKQKDTAAVKAAG